MRFLEQRWRNAFAALILLGTALVLYFYTLTPVVTFVDSGELAAVVGTRGVSHPSGSPFWLLLASLAAAVPFGTLIQRLNAFSAVCASVSVAVTYLAFVQTTRVPFVQRPVVQPPPKLSGKRKKRKAPEKPVVIRPPAVPPEPMAVFAGGIAAALTWLTNRALWDTGTETEVYSLYALLMTILGFLLFTYVADYETERSKALRRLGLAAVVGGLGVATYPPFGMVGTAVVLLVVLTERDAFVRHWPRQLLLLLLFFAGLVPYVLLPLRAMSDPLINWGDPSNWARFWKHISAEQYQVYMVHPRLEQVPGILAIWWHQWPPWIWLLLIPGALKLMWSRPRLFAYTLLLGIFNCFYMMVYDTTEVRSAPTDYYVYLLPLIWCSSLWIGWTFVLLMQAAGRLWQQGARVRQAKWAIALLALLPLTAAAFNWGDVNHRHYTYADDFAQTVLRSVAPNATILAQDWNFASASMYLQYGENLRRDVTVLDGELLRRTWYLDYVRKSAPWLYQACKPSIEGFREQVLKYETGRRYDPQVITAHFVTMLNDILATGNRLNHPSYILLNLQSKERDPDWYRKVEQALGHPPYITPGVPANQVGAGMQWIPETIAFRLYAGSPLVAQQMPEVAAPPHPIDPHREYDANTLGIFDRYAEFWRWRGDYYLKRQDCPHALESYRKAMQIDPDLPEAVDGASKCSSSVHPAS